MSGSGSSHDVVNQSGHLVDINLYETDQALREGVLREGDGVDEAVLQAHGALMGQSEMFDLGRLANTFTPQLRTHDAKGHRLDFIEFHPAYHQLMAASARAGLHNRGWQGTGAHAVRAALFYMTSQVEPGHCCPITMTHAAIPVLETMGGAGEDWLEKAKVAAYDQSFKVFSQKTSVTIGMGMTEKQGGSDVRANQTQARASSDGFYALTGHKWFLSAPMSDAFLVLAQAPGGLSCFLVPRHLPDGTLNGLEFQRLKDKLGNRSNASAEVEFFGARGWIIGEEGDGTKTIMQMVMSTRLDCAVGSAGLMRRAVAMAVHHCRQRKAFGRRLIEQPVMQCVLGDLAVETEAALCLSLRLARSFDVADDQRAAAWRRLMTPVTKYWVCKVAPMVICEAMECLGGNGYVEENGMALLYREAPVNSIWEGSGNIMALDVFRVLQREADVAGIVLDDLEQAIGDDPHLKAALARVRGYLHEPRSIEFRLRSLLEGLATLAIGAILRDHAPGAVSDAFIAARLWPEPRQTYGQGLERVDPKPLIDRLLPEV